MHRPDRHDVACTLAWILCAGLYLWVASGVSAWSAVGTTEDSQYRWRRYELLVDGFLGGHLSLPLEPSPGLLALPDPYDPVRNEPYRLSDATLYRGKYYLYFGPTPALLLMLPWKVVTGHHLPQWATAAVFAAAGLAAIALLLGGLRRRFFPGATPAQLFLAVVVAAHVSWLFVLLQRPAFWELPIIAAAALFWWSLFFLWKYHASGRQTRWAVAAGTALAFTLGARSNYAPCAALVALLFALPLQPGLKPAGYLRRLWPVAVPLALGATGLLIYNYERFGQALEFGQHYELWEIEYRGRPLFSLANVAVNLWLYFFTTPEFSPYFPFFHGVAPDNLPASYLGTEDIHGLVFTLPAILLAAAALVHGYRHRADAIQRPLLYVLVAALAGGAVTGGILLCFGGSCSRYVTELLAGWTPLAAIGFLAVSASGRPLTRWVAGGTIAWSVACVWLASFEYQGLARATHPTAYRTLAEIFNRPSDWVARNAGQKFGPVALEVHLSESSVTGWAVLLAAGHPLRLNRLFIERLAPDQVRFRVMANNFQVIKTPVLHVTGPVVKVECAFPWLYPPAAHPYWRTYADPDERQRRQNLFTLVVDGHSYTESSRWIFDATAFAPLVRVATTLPPGCAWVDRFQRLEPPHGDVRAGSGGE